MRKTTLSACFALSILVAGCAHDSTFQQSFPIQPDTKRGAESATAVDVTDRCRELSQPQVAPKDWVGKNVYVSRREYVQALKSANARLAYTDECIRTLTTDYAKGLPR